MTPMVFRAGLVAAVVILSIAKDLDAGLAPHGDLRGSDPAKGSHLATPPSRIMLWFTTRPQLSFSRIRLIGASGEVALGKLSADTGNAIRADVAAPMADGTYRVAWQMASADGHPVTGEYSFSVGAATALSQPSTGPGGSVSSPSLGARVVRLWEFVGLLVVLGTIVFVLGVLPPLAARGVHTADVSQHARGLGEVGAVIYLLASLFRLVQQAAAVGASEATPLQALVEILTASGWGRGWLTGAVGASLVIVGFWLSMRRLAAGTPTTLTGAVAMTVSPALSGHAAAAHWFIPSVTLDALHVASIGAWLGTLTVLVLIGIPAMARVKDGNSDAAVSALVNSFHPIALLCAPLAVIAGLGSSALRLGSIAALTGSRYGELLIIKVALVALVASFGAWNSMRARRRLGTLLATKSIQRSAATEVVLALLVLWATTDLIATPAPAELLGP